MRSWKKLPKAPKAEVHRQAALTYLVEAEKELTQIFLGATDGHRYSCEDYTRMRFAYYDLRRIINRFRME